LRSRSLLIFLVWFFLILIIATRIDTFNYAFMASRSAADVPAIFRFFGEGRNIVSYMAILQADRYYHGGVGHIEHAEGGGLSVASRGRDSYDEEEGHHPEASPFNILFRIQDNTQVTGHVHLKGDKVKEIIPWLYFSAEIDPHNVLAITLTGFYLADKLDKPQEAVAYLRKGLLDNPDSWEINAELGRIYFQDLGNYKAAVDFLSKAMELQKQAPHDKFQERYVLSFLAHTYEALGDKEKAVPLYRRLSRLFPKDHRLRRKIDDLTS